MRIVKEGRTIKLNDANAIYQNDIRMNFDFYFNSVENDGLMVDFSEPREHNIVGFGPLLCPSFPEPVGTIDQYLNFAKLEPDHVMFDLGAYAGLSAIIFKRFCHTVIAVEPDPRNAKCLRENLRRYIPDGIGIDHRPLWSEHKQLVFSSEGCMGSTALQFVSPHRGQHVELEAITLSDLAESQKLDRVDFIKCDIEGAEAEIFKDKAFFKKFRPKIIIEPHEINGKLNAEVVVEHLKAVGYSAKIVPQLGSTLPLIEAVP